MLEDFAGIPLRRLMHQRLETNRLLALALAVTRAVADLHHHQIVHKDLNPDNVLVEPVTGAVKLVALGIASVLPRELQPPRSLTLTGWSRGRSPICRPSRPGG